ncbi:MAG: hypothetical protein LUE09_14195 [Synergistaceae bacterium]|nr:hypothetical protein [Synergistaceae bacterium]
MKKIVFLLSKFEEIIMVAGGLLMVFMNFANVVCRYLLPTTPFSYTEELVVLLFVWVSMSRTHTGDGRTRFLRSYRTIYRESFR